MSVEHATSQQDEIERAKQIVARILSMRDGPESAISSTDLADRTPVKATTVRDLIPQIIDEYRIPIASCPQGYYRVSSREELADEMERFESQREAAQDRMERLAKAFYGGRGNP